MSLGLKIRSFRSAGLVEIKADHLYVLRPEMPQGTEGPVSVCESAPIVDSRKGFALACRNNGSGKFGDPFPESRDIVSVSMNDYD
jgi:hypothetical protein